MTRSYVSPINLNLNCAHLFIPAQLEHHFHSPHERVVAETEVFEADFFFLLNLRINGVLLAYVDIISSGLFMESSNEPLELRGLELLLNALAGVGAK